MNKQRHLNPASGPSWKSNTNASLYLLGQHLDFVTQLARYIPPYYDCLTFESYRYM